MSSLSDLIARVENASGPDRRLDFDLWATITNPDGFPALSEPEESRTGWFDTWKDRGGFPLYTASIDAALTLLPEGFAAAVGTMAFKNCDRKPWATYWTPQGVPHSVEAATPALAVVIAALKARLLDAASSEAADQ